MRRTRASGRPEICPLVSRLLFFALPALILASCSEFPGKLRVIEGGFRYAGGHYAEAIESYRKALAYSEAAPYAEYGLGVIYLALGEDEEALGRFEAASLSLESLEDDDDKDAAAGHRELRYRIHYNSAVIRFQQGNYAGAAAGFRRALETDGSRIEAKRNLELSLLSLDRGGNGDALPAGEGNSSAGGEILFDYIRQKEQEKWRSREWAEGETPSGPDY
ncbi:MAG: tetratricopeptide repeat protein [Treponema sp.]|nr:tetratricopeptide repeat protein [Treponema sp.]